MLRRWQFSLARMENPSKDGTCQGFAMLAKKNSHMTLLPLAGCTFVPPGFPWQLSSKNNSPIEIHDWSTFCYGCKNNSTSSLGSSEILEMSSFSESPQVCMLTGEDLKNSFYVWFTEAQGSHVLPCLIGFNPSDNTDNSDNWDFLDPFVVVFLYSPSSNFCCCWCCATLLSS